MRETNIRTFLNLIQLDGFNPLVLKGAQFHFKRSSVSAKLLTRRFGKKNAALCHEFLKDPFNPGELYDFLLSRRLVTQKSFNRILASFFGLAAYGSVMNPAVSGSVVGGLSSKQEGKS